MQTLSSLNDAELAALISSGGESVFREIYNRYWDKLYVVARKRMNDPYEAEEIIQDIFCNFWKKRETLVLTQGFNNYFSVAVKSPPARAARPLSLIAAANFSLLTSKSAGFSRPLT